MYVNIYSQSPNNSCQLYETTRLGQLIETVSYTGSPYNGRFVRYRKRFPITDLAAYGVRYRKWFPITDLAAFPITDKTYVIGGSGNETSCISYNGPSRVSYNNN